MYVQNSQSDYKGEDNSMDKRVRVHYRLGDDELEAEGPPEEVNKHTAVFLSVVAKGKSVQLQLPFPVEEETPLLGESSDVSSVIRGNGRNQQPPDLLSVYLKKAPKSQWQEILVITYWYQQYEHHEHVSTKDYRDAYRMLRRAGVKEPANISARAQDAVDRTYLYKSYEDQYGLTVQGEQFVDSMGAEA